MLNLPQDLTYWNANAPAANFPQLASDISVDVAIIGGGIVGITTARLLKDAGLTVTVIEAREVGRQVTGKSTAKITSQHSIIYQTLERTRSEEHTSELQSLMRLSYAVFCLQKNKKHITQL